MLGRRLALVLLLGLLGCGSNPPDDSPPDEPSDDSAVSTHAMPGRPVGLVADAEGQIWAVVPDRGLLVSVADPDTSIGVGETPLRAALAEGSLWVTSFHDGTVAQVDPGTAELTRQLDVGVEPEGIAAGFGAIWVVLQDAGQLARLDPATGQTVALIDVGAGPRLVIADATSLWVSDFTTGRVARVDPNTGTVTSSEKICDGPQGMAEHDGTLWVACTRSNEIVGVAAADLSVLERIEAPGSPDALASDGAGTLIVALQEGPALRLLDPVAAELGTALALDDGPQLFDQANIDVRIEGETVWLSSFNESAVYEVPLAELA